MVIMDFCKQYKWTEGIEIVLQSKAMRNIYLQMDLESQQTFCRKVIMLPYAKVDSGDEFRAPSAPRDKRESELHRERKIEA